MTKGEDVERIRGMVADVRAQVREATELLTAALAERPSDETDQTGHLVT